MKKIPYFEFLEALGFHDVEEVNGKINGWVGNIKFYELKFNGISSNKNKSEEVKESYSFKYKEPKLKGE